MHKQDDKLIRKCCQRFEQAQSTELKVDFEINKDIYKFYNRSVLKPGIKYNLQAVKSI